MRLEFAHGRCCPGMLQPGEAKRVPKSALLPCVGLYVGCPRCGRPQVVTSRRLDPNLGQDIQEAGEMLERVSFGPGHRCDRCGVVFSARDSEIQIHG